MQVVILSRVKRNPYVSLLCKGLQQATVDDATVIKPQVVDQFTLRWLWQERRNIDVLHVHWLELFFIYPSWRTSVKRWLSVMLALMLARVSGIALVYTMHNVWQHEGKRPVLVWLGNLLVLTLAQGVHVHDKAQAETLARRWHRHRGVYVIEHGHYAHAYPNECSREESRRWLDLPADAFVYLFLGRVRPYKGIEELLRSFHSIDAVDSILLIAGEPHEASYGDQIRDLCADQDRVRLHLGFVAGEELQYYLGAADISVLPYRHVTTSGAGILSLSFGSPIIAPRMGYLAQLVGDNERGLAYEPNSESALTEAMGRIREMDMAALREACGIYVAKMGWRRIAQEHANVYAQIMGIGH